MKLLALLVIGPVVLAAACRDSGPPQVAPAAVSPGSGPAPTVSAAPSETASTARPEPAPAAPAATFVPQKVTGEGHAMGTHLSFAAFTTPALDGPHVQEIFSRATDEIVRLEKLMTTWDPTSEISQVNAAAGKHGVVVSPETFDVVREALHASAISEGTFDITFETLHGLWKFDQDLDPHPPTPAQVQGRIHYLGWSHVKLDEAAHTIALDEAHVRIGLGGIAKGYAVDRASKVLADAGVTTFFVQAGGDLFTQGVKPDGNPWIAGIRDPRGPESDYFAMMPVNDHAFSTAGDYERSYMVSGKRYHHIIDPRTGYPATASRSVTIWAPTALLADELDDAVFILGPQKGLALVESIDGVGAVIVDAHDKVWTSKRLEGHVQMVHPPTDAP